MTHMHEIADIACNFTSDRFDNELDEVDDSNNVRDTLISMILRKESD